MAAAILLVGFLFIAWNAAAQKSYVGLPDLGTYHGCYAIANLPPEACGSPKGCQDDCAKSSGYWAWTVEGSYCVTEDDLKPSTRCHTPCGNKFEDGLCTPPDGRDCDGFPVYKCPPPFPSSFSPPPPPPRPTVLSGSTTCRTTISSSTKPPAGSTSSCSPPPPVSKVHTTASCFANPPPGECSMRCITVSGQGPPTPCPPPQTIQGPPGCTPSQPSCPPPAGTSQYGAAPGGGRHDTSHTLLTTAASTAVTSKPSGSKSTASTNSAGTSRINAGAVAVFLAVVMAAA